uniref:Uncharacterized protein n=1 Tax=Vitrella brassicaformis TaxID=1169539 RepID=A0A7S1JWJ1_9ALVE
MARHWLCPSSRGQRRHGSSRHPHRGADGHGGAGRQHMDEAGIQQVAAALFVSQRDQIMTPSFPQPASQAPVADNTGEGQNEVSVQPDAAQTTESGPSSEQQQQPQQNGAAATPTQQTQQTQQMLLQLPLAGPPQPHPHPHPQTPHGDPDDAFENEEMADGNGDGDGTDRRAGSSGGKRKRDETDEREEEDEQEQQEEEDDDGNAAGEDNHHYRHAQENGHEPERGGGMHRDGDNEQQQQQQDDPPTTGTTRIYPNVPLTYKLRFLRTTKDAACEKSDFMRSFMASATQHANGVWSVRATDAVTATGRSPPELSQELAKAANGEGFTVNRCDWQARGVMVVIRGGGEHQEDGREDAFGGMRAAVEATLQKLYETLKVGVAKLEAAFMALYLSTKETGAQAQLDKLNSLVQAYFAHTQGGAGCPRSLLQVVCDAAVGAAKADGLIVQSRLEICGGEIGSESFLRFKHLFVSAPMNSDQVDQWGISTRNGVRHRTKIANQLSHAVKNTLKNMPLLYELTERRPTASARDVAVNHLAPLTIARALARINTHSLPKPVCEAFNPITMGAPQIATLPFGFLLDAAQRAVTQHKEQLLMHTRQFLRQRQEQHEDKKRPPPAAGAAGAPHRPRKKARKADSSEAVPGAAAKRAPKRRRGEGSAD